MIKRHFANLSAQMQKTCAVLSFMFYELYLNIN